MRARRALDARVFLRRAVELAPNRDFHQEDIAPSGNGIATIIIPRRELPFYIVILPGIPHPRVFLFVDKGIERCGRVKYSLERYKKKRNKS